MTTPTIDTLVLDTTDGVDPASARCGVCDHVASSHDPIGRRFCAATMAHALTRGCICR